MEPNSPHRKNEPGSGRPDAHYGYPAIGQGLDTRGAAQRGFDDYVLILRERIWYIVLVFLVVFATALVYTLTRTRIYESTATVQILRRDPSIMPGQAVVDSEIRSAEDLNTQIKILESGNIIQKVAERLTGDDQKQFLAPYEKSGGTAPLSVAEVLADNRKIVPQRLTLIILVGYRHPDRFMAAKVANLFVDEFISYNARTRTDESMKAVEDLKVSVEQQRKKVDEIALGLQAYREKNHLISLDQRKDIVTEKLKALSLYLTQATTRLKDAEVRWTQVKERREKGGDLTDLPFIASQGLITQLTQQLAAQKIVFAQMHERYRDKHPKMIEASNSIQQTERELAKAVRSAASAVEADYQTASLNEKEARAQLAAQEAESLNIDRYAVEYDNLSRDLKINEQILQTIIGRTRETSMTSSVATQNARMVDRARPIEKPASPNIPLNLGIGAGGGLLLGLAFALFVAYIDDRVKSLHDIEHVVGLPLLGIIPRIRRMADAEKARVAVNQSDRQVAESFLTLHSSLRLKDESRLARCILTTSTIPGEGKSFTTSNLGLTFAAHGERVVIVDCDLRKPNIHRSFGLENTKGVIDVCAGTATIDDVVIKAVQPNLDVIVAGGRAKNPTHVLNHANFGAMIAELRKRYDRVFIDTPPLAAVSDAMIILPLVDGSIFTIFFNKVRRQAAQFGAKKLLESTVPCFGAVLNGLNLAVSGYYYAQYYDKSYRDYYVMMSKDDRSKAR
jgi:capsular exopolysaccharide synthesis family protein